MSQTSTNTVLWAVLGFCCGLLFLFLGGLMVGAGHGWTSGANSGASIFVLPFVGAAIANRTNKKSILYGTIAFLGMIVLDIWIYKATEEEGSEYFSRAMPVSGFWLILWVSWQVAVVWVLKTGFRLVRRANTK